MMKVEQKHQLRWPKPGDKHALKPNLSHQEMTLCLSWIFLKMNRDLEQENLATKEWAPHLQANRLQAKLPHAPENPWGVYQLPVSRRELGNGPLAENYRPALGHAKDPAVRKTGVQRNEENHGGQLA